MRIVIRKLDQNMQAPKEFAVLSEQEMLEHGYIWEYDVYNGAGMCVRSGMSKIKDEAELRRFLDSGMNRLEWEAIHGKP